MPYIQAGEIQLHYEEYGSGDNNIGFIHGNLGCKNWMDLVWPQLSDSFHIYAFDWRGCGKSDKPAPLADFSNYSMKQHAIDMINAINGLEIERCHLVNHSTGGIICTHMLLMQPDTFEKVLCLDPVGPQGMELPEGSSELFQAMKENSEVAFSVLAGTAPGLFTPESLIPGSFPVFNSAASKAQKDLFNTIVEKTRKLSDGIWHGTPIQLAREYESGWLTRQLENIPHEHLVVWGENDAWIPREHVEEMVNLLPSCKLMTVPNTGHSLNLENPAKFAEIFKEFFTA